MAWHLTITLQERGTKKEVSEFIEFASRDAAVAAATKIEADLKTSGSEDQIIVDSGNERVSFDKQDYRRSKISEIPEAALIVDHWADI